MLGERRFGVAPIDTGGRGVDEMFHRELPAALEHIVKPNNVGLNVGVWVGDAVAHTCLCRKMNDALKFFLGKQRLQICDLLQ